MTIINKLPQFIKNTSSQLQKSGIQPNKTSYFHNAFMEHFFKTQRGMEARAMNLAALNSIKFGMPQPKGKHIEDIELFASNAADMVKKWVQWVNPANGKMYTIINKKENPDSTRLVRILDESGELIKESTIAPKKAIILDNFYEPLTDNEIKKVTQCHGTLVKKFFERNNPIADVECINVGIDATVDTKTSADVLESILQRIKNGEKIDVINCSFGLEENLLNKHNLSMHPDAKKIALSYPAIQNKLDTLLENIQKNNDMPETAREFKLIKEIIDSGTRIVFAAGNGGKENYSLYSAIKGADMVGALDEAGKVSSFSSSRALAPHLELGCIKPVILENGINITGTAGVDIPIKNKPFKHLEGKKLEACLASKSEFEEYLELLKEQAFQNIDEKKFEAISKKFKDKVIDDKQYKILSSYDFYKRSFASGRITKESFTNRLNKLKEQISDGNPSNVLTKKVRHIFGAETIAITDDGFLAPYLSEYRCLNTLKTIDGTSFAAPTRSAKILLNEAMKEILGE